MAQLEHKGLHPIVGFLLGPITYFIIGQGKKGMMGLVLVLILSVCTGGFLGLLGLLPAFDAYKVCEALQNGEAVDEHEYRFDIWYKIAKLLHKEATIHEG